MINQGSRAQANSRENRAFSGYSHTDLAVRCISSASTGISIISPIKAIPS